MAEILFKGGVNNLLTQSDINFCLGRAVNSRKPGLVELLLSAKADPNHLDSGSPDFQDESHMDSPLHKALKLPRRHIYSAEVEADFESIIDALLAAGANVNLQNSSGETPLFISIQQP
jgi:ankyrin repeat protein